MRRFCGYLSRFVRLSTIQQNFPNVFRILLKCVTWLSSRYYSADTAVDDNCMLAKKLSVSLSQYFGAVRTSLVVIRGVVGHGGGIHNCITQPSKVTNIINSLGDSSSLELRDQPSCLACMTCRYTDGCC
jgi:hypothetical protein